MTQYIIRDTATGALLGSPFSNNKFKWHGTNAVCITRLAHGLTYGDQMVYEIIETSSGEGSVVSVAAPEYDEANGRVVRHTTRTKSASDIERAAKKWVYDRAKGYEATILDLKGMTSGGQVVALGFAMDAVIAELVARGAAVTPEFAELLTRIAAVKQANPKPVI